MAKISDTILNLLKGWWNNKSSLLSSATDTLLALLHTAQTEEGALSYFSQLLIDGGLRY